MEYRTRGNADPKGKPGVYICCHPEDGQVYFEPLAERLLKLHNCAVWCGSGEGEDLRGMKLFVVPVTTRLLTKPCDAMDRWLPFALEEHIPVLPLLMEPGLETLYTRRFQALQFLVPDAADPTADSFEKKLERYLSAVLIGDELAERVRAAFDAYVFLSYRKKDRSLARELMRLIHADPLCRDIAIWFDEMLTPGEDFNDSIIKAMQKSRLFLLAVTPSLVEDMNYIMRIEYPLAVEEKKPILPVELVPTDRGALERCFAGIPDCVSREGTVRLLLQTVRQEALRRGNSPQHDYFIGLAYLGGIDVEENRPLAVDLITAAARRGLPEAAEKLAQMFETGTGVAVSFEDSLYWRRKETELRRALWEKEDTPENLVGWFCAAEELAERLRQVGRATEGIRQLQPLLSQLLRYDEGTLLGRCRSLLAFCHSDLGNREEEVRHLMLWALDMEERQEKEADEEKRWHFRRELSRAYDALGDHFSAMGLFNTAEKYFQKEVAIDEERLAVFGDELARDALAHSLGQLGQLHRDRLDFAGAEELVRRALTLTEALVEEDESRAHRLSTLLGRLGEILERRGDQAGATDCARREAALDRQLHRQQPSPRTLRNLAVSLSHLGDRLTDEGKPEEAGTVLEEALELCRELVERYETAEDKRLLANLLVTLSECRKKQLDNEEALALLREALGFAREAAAVLSCAAATTAVVGCTSRIFSLLVRMEQPGQARALVEEERKLLMELMVSSGDPELQRDLAMNHFRMAWVHGEFGEHEQAVQCLRECVAGCRRRREGVDARRAGEDLATALTELGKQLRLTGSYEEAEKCLKEALPLRRSRGIDPLVQTRELARTLEELASLMSSLDRWDEGEGYLKESIACNEKLYSKAPSGETRWNLSVARERMGELLEDRERFREAAGHFSAALALREGDSPMARRGMGTCLLGLLRCAIGQRDDRETERYFRQAKALWERLAAEENTSEDHRRLALVLHDTGVYRGDCRLLTEAIGRMESALAREPSLENYSRLRYSATALTELLLYEKRDPVAAEAPARKALEAARMGERNIMGRVVLVTALVELAISLQMQEKFDQCRKALEECLELYENFEGQVSPAELAEARAKAWQQVGVCATCGEEEDSREVWEKQLEEARLWAKLTDAEDAWAAVGIGAGMLYHAFGIHRRLALDTYRMLCSRYPENPEYPKRLNDLL